MSTNLPALIRLYCSVNRPRYQAELEWYKGQLSLTDALNAAAMALDHRGKRHPHQARLTRANLEAARDLLAHHADSIAHCKEFDELFQVVERVMRPIHGLGELYCYDTAQRIGAYLGLLPKRVYLHAGTRRGAKALGLDVSGQAIEVAQLPEPLRSLPPDEIEDFLCIHKGRLAA